MTIGILISGLEPKAFKTILPEEIVPPQRPQAIYATNCSSVALLFGAISTASLVSVMLELLMVYVYGGSEPPQLPLLRVTSMSLLFISAHLVLGLSLWWLRPTLIQNSKIQNITLSSTSWSGSEAPFSYTVSNSNVTSTSKVVEIMPANGATNDQLEAYLSAGMCGGATGTGTITIKAFGKKPSTNIPITIVVRGEI